MYADAKDGTSLLDVGLVAGIGATVELSARVALMLEARYNHGMISVDGSGESEIQNRAVFLVFGVGALMNPGTNAPILKPKDEDESPEDAESEPEPVSWLR